MNTHVTYKLFFSSGIATKQFLPLRSSYYRRPQLLRQFVTSVVLRVLSKGVYKGSGGTKILTDGLSGVELN